jgi:hypothetical protein
MFLIVHTPVLDFILGTVSLWACGVNLRQYARGDMQSIGRRRMTAIMGDSHLKRCPKMRPGCTPYVLIDNFYFIVLEE